jgi:hypothetical protein
MEDIDHFTTSRDQNPFGLSFNNFELESDLMTDFVNPDNSSKRIHSLFDHDEAPLQSSRLASPELGFNLFERGYLPQSMFDNCSPQ